ncbi:MAG: 50S ribosomal protein L4 [Patescibacteria group bacterium]
MAKVTVYNSEGKSAGEVVLDQKVFGVDIKPELVQQAVRTQMANRRIVLAHTKDRSEVRGGGKKPWRQKGTGRSRHGSIRSPLWKGGGVTFGPLSNRNFELKMNKKARRKALLMCLTARAAAKELIVIDTIDMKGGKTKAAMGFFKKLPVKGSVLLVVPKLEQQIVRATRNIPSVKVIRADSINVVDLLSFHFIVAAKGSLDIIKKTYLA